MDVAFVVARMFQDTRDLVRSVAASEDHQAVLISDDAPVEEALRTIRHTDRIWFEGRGRLFDALLRRCTSYWIRDAVLRVGAEEIEGLHYGDLRPRVSDVVLYGPGGTDAEQRLQVEPSLRVHRVGGNRLTRALERQDPRGELETLSEVLLTPAGDVRRHQWRWLWQVGQLCGRRTLLVGEPPAAAIDFLQTCHGVEPVPAEQAARSVDTILLWDCLLGDSAADMIRNYLPRLRSDGTVAIILAEKPRAGRLSRNAAIALLNNPELWSNPVEITWDASAVFVQPVARKEALSAPSDVEIRAEWPLISAVMPVWNDEARVSNAIESLRRQTYPNLEIVVIDDGSTDATAERVAKHLDDPRVKYFYKAHSGRPESRNLGVKKSSGAYIAWLDSDDEALPNRIAAQIAAAGDGADILHSDGLFFRADGTFKERRRYLDFTAEEAPALLLEGFATRCPILNTSAMIRRSLYDRIGLYDKEFFRCQDYDFYVRSAIAGDVKWRHIPSPLVKVDAGRPRWDALERALGIYTKLAFKLLDGCPDRLLAPPAARDLHEDCRLAIARALVSLATLYEADEQHALIVRAKELLAATAGSAASADRAEAANLQGVLAEHLEHPGEAENRYRQALALHPGLRSATENLKSLQRRHEEAAPYEPGIQPTDAV
jgi:hypothetical protein